MLPSASPVPAHLARSSRRHVASLNHPAQLTRPSRVFRRPIQISHSSSLSSLSRSIPRQRPSHSITSIHSRLTSTSSPTSLPRFNVLFCGSDDFSVACLDAIHRSDVWESIHVVTPSEKRLITHRKATDYIPSLRDYAVSAGLPRSEIPREGIKSWLPPSFPSPSFPASTSTSSTSILVTASFGYIIPTPILDLFPGRSINVHPSLLPRYRGAAPVQWAIANGDESTGVTVQTLVPRERGIDGGEVLGAVESVPIPPSASYGDLLPRLAAIGGDLLVDVLRQMQTGQSRPTSQDPAMITRAPKIRQDTARVCWAKQSVIALIRLSRGISHQFPLWTTLNGHHVQLLAVAVPESSTLPRWIGKDHLAQPGTASFDKFNSTPRLLVTCAPEDGNEERWLEVKRIKVADGKAASVADWWNGLPKASRKLGYIHFDR